MLRRWKGWKTSRSHYQKRKLSRKALTICIYQPDPADNYVGYVVLIFLRRMASPCSSSSIPGICPGLGPAQSTQYLCRRTGECVIRSSRKKPAPGCSTWKVSLGVLLPSNLPPLLRLSHDIATGLTRPPGPFHDHAHGQDFDNEIKMLNVAGALGIDTC